MGLSNNEQVSRVRKFLYEKLREAQDKTAVCANDIEDILRETKFYEHLESEDSDEVHTRYRLLL